MKKLKISIIIPVYNTQQYLEECLNSCINQTLKDIEIICVDDCSIDNSLNILDEYAKKDERIKVFKHEYNKKQGAARNTGLNHASGEYIWFIDSDDFVDLYACQILYDTITKTNVNLLSFSGIAFRDTEEGRKYENSDYYLEFPLNKVICPKRDWKDFTCRNLNVQPCMYITKKEVIKNHRFRENVFFEDVDFSSILFSSVETLYRMNYSGYHRRFAPQSTIMTVDLEKKAEYLIKAILRIDEYISEKSIPYKHFLFTYIIQIMNQINKLTLETEKIDIQQKKIFKQLKIKYSGFYKLLKKFGSFF